MLIGVLLRQHCSLTFLNETLELLRRERRGRSSQALLHSRALGNPVGPQLEMGPPAQIQAERVCTLKDPGERHDVGDGVLGTGEVRRLFEAVLKNTEEVLYLVQELLNGIVRSHGGKCCKGKCLACAPKSALVIGAIFAV